MESSVDRRDYESASPRLKCCRRHRDRNVDFFCKKHDVLFCNLCRHVYHKDCKADVIPLNEAAKDSKDGVAQEDVRNRIRGITETLQNIYEGHSENIDTVKLQNDSIFSKISETRKQINAYFDTIENTMYQKASETFDCCKTSSEATLANVDKLRELLVKRNKYICDMRNDASEVDFFLNLKSLDAEITAIENGIGKFNAAIQMQYCEQNIKDQLEKHIKTLGAISTRSLKIELSEPVKHQAGQIPKHLANALKPFISFKTANLSCICVTRGCFLPNRKLLLPAQYGPRVFICNYDGTEIQKVELQHIPVDVAVVDNNSAIATLGDKGFQIFDFRTLKVGRCIKPGWWWKQDCYAVTCNNGKIWVDNRSKQGKLIEIDVKGNFLREIKTKFKSYFISLSNTGDIYYTSPDSRSVFKVSQDGSESTFFRDNDLLRVPRGIDVDDKGNVYMCGGQSNNIIRISRDGRKYDVVFSEHNGVRYPLGLRLSSSGKEILVVEKDGERIDIFKLD